MCLIKRNMTYIPFNKFSNPLCTSVTYFTEKCSSNMGLNLDAVQDMHANFHLHHV
uniref:Uncharacterized protein n=1 Tax=Arundo donax TaxID=35708 RepID=A0A0A9FQQ5_ARUDO